MTGENMILAAIARRQAQGLSVEVQTSDGPHVRHCIDLRDRDAYIARCVARGETIRILGN